MPSRGVKALLPFSPAGEGGAERWMRERRRETAETPFPHPPAGTFSRGEKGNSVDDSINAN
jgi:hypothetical protein